MSGERETSLLRAIQISDLHIGTVADGPAGSLDAAQPWFSNWIPPLGSLLGHHWSGLADCHDFCASEFEEDPSTHFIVTGDVTVCGTPDQFRRAAQFLGPPDPSSRFGMGLGLRPGVDIVIPGNHDAWPGGPWMIGSPTSGFHGMFPKPFPISMAVQLQGGYSIRWMLMNSDSGVKPYSVDRVLARGKFTDQVAALEDMVPPRPPPGEIRVLVLHHAIMGGDVPETPGVTPFPQARSLPRMLEIDGATLRILERFLVERHIRVVLSGHLHGARLTEMVATAGRRKISLLESRCGSTTQRDRIPTAIFGRAGLHRLPTPNTLVVHELLLRRDAPIWRCKVFDRVEGEGFLETVGGGAYRGLPEYACRELAL